MKPLGTKSYGSIPHLPGSRVGPGDYHISEGQVSIANVKTRDRYDLVFVQFEHLGEAERAAVQWYCWKVREHLVSLSYFIF